jgi:hypothetical protein
MIHVFLLFVFIGSESDKRLVSQDMYFKSLDDCIWYAQTLHKQGSKITAYCLPTVVDNNVKVY